MLGTVREQLRTDIEDYIRWCDHNDCNLENPDAITEYINQRIPVDFEVKNKYQN